MLHHNTDQLYCFTIPNYYTAPQYRPILLQQNTYLLYCSTIKTNLLYCPTIALYKCHKIDKSIISDKNFTSRKSLKPLINTSFKNFFCQKWACLLHLCHFILLKCIHFSPNLQLFTSINEQLKQIFPKYRPVILPCNTALMPQNIAPKYLLQILPNHTAPQFCPTVLSTILPTILPHKIYPKLLSHNTAPQYWLKILPYINAP